MATYPCRVVPASAFGPQRPKAFYTAPPAFPAPPPYPTASPMGYTTASGSSSSKPPTRPEPPSSASIPDLRDAISSLDSKMASLMRERHALESSLERAVRLQAPIHRIPSEVLSQIYLMGVYADDNPVMIPTLMLVWCVSRYLTNWLAPDVPTVTTGLKLRWRPPSYGQRFQSVHTTRWRKPVGSSSVQRRVHSISPSILVPARSTRRTLQSKSYMPWISSGRRSGGLGRSA